MQIVVDKVSGDVVWRTGFCYQVNGQLFWPTAEMAIADAVKNVSDLVEANLLTWETRDEYLAKTFQSCEPGDLVVVIENDVITDVQHAPDPPTLYVHSTLTGGMQSPSGTLYLKNDGIDALQVHAELRDGPDPATSGAVTQLEGQDITAMWALELVNVDTGALADTPLVQMTAGVIDVNYTTTIAPCEVELAENRFEMIGDYQLKLAQSVRFKVVRMLS